MTDWIGETFTSDVGWDHLERLVNIGNRMAGSEGEREAAEATRDALAEAGARDARLESFDLQGWTRGDSHVETGETAQDAIALPRSPAGDVTAELVDVGYGLPEDFEEVDLDGKIAMARSDVPDWYDRYLHRREKYFHAVEAGASAFVYRNHVEGCLPPTGSVSGKEGGIGEIPAIGVSKEVGARLARRFDGETVTVSVDCDVHDATSQNVHAELGPDTDEAVLLTSHVDAHDIAEGARDNGAGTAMAVEVTRALARREDELDTRVHVICYGAEEVGLVGASHHADRANHDAIKAILNDDGIVGGRTLRLYSHGFPELRDAAETVADRFDHPISVVPKLGPHSDHWEYVKWGVPGYHAASETEGSGRGWGHTYADTLDKLEPRTFREQAILLTDLVVELADDDRSIEHRDPADVAEQLEDEDLAESMKITGDWPYDD